MAKQKLSKYDPDDFSDQWRVHVPSLLREIVSSTHGGATFLQPFRIFGKLLFDVGARAAELNDPELNALMVRLTIYAISDPFDPAYNPSRVKEILEIADKIKAEKNEASK